MASILSNGTLQSNDASASFRSISTPSIPRAFGYQRRIVVSYNIDDIWSIDLVDMTNVKYLNRQYTFILTVIDLFSRYAWAVPLKNKSSSDVLEAFKKIIESSDRKPKKIWADEGKEFLNKQFQKFMTENDMSIYHTYSKEKASIIERFNRTLKTHMFYKFTENNNKDWYSILPGLLEDYNNSVHSTIKMTPIEASLSENSDKILALQSEKVSKIKRVKAKFNILDRVRAFVNKGVFEKGYSANWSKEIFTIIKVITSIPPTYKISDINNIEQKGSYYEAELQKTRM